MEVLAGVEETIGEKLYEPSIRTIAESISNPNSRLGKAAAVRQALLAAGVTKETAHLGAYETFAESWFDRAKLEARLDRIAPLDWKDLERLQKEENALRARVAAGQGSPDDIAELQALEGATSH
jgi:hypothetical protein